MLRGSRDKGGRELGTRTQGRPTRLTPGWTKPASDPARPDPKAPGREEPRCPHSPAPGAAGAARLRLGLLAAPGCRCRSPAKRRAGAAGSRQGRRRAGAGTGRRRHRREAGTRCAAGGIPAGPALTWVRGRGAAGGGGGIPSGMPPASPAPSPGSAAAREEGHGAGGEGGGSWAERGGCSLPHPAPAPASEPRLRAPASRASSPRRPRRGPKVPEELRDPPRYRWARTRIPRGGLGQTRGPPSRCPGRHVGSVVLLLPSGTQPGLGLLAAVCP